MQFVMKDRKTRYKGRCLVVLALAAGLFAGCSSHDDAPAVTPVDKGEIICFSAGASEIGARALIGHGHDGADMHSLEDACKDIHPIGLYSEKREGTAEWYNIFADVDDAWVNLGYDSNGKQWVIENATPQYWSKAPGGATYEFLAFYPNDESVVGTADNPKIYKGPVDAQTESFSLAYNTHDTQVDLLVAYNEVHTVDPITYNPSVLITAGNNGTYTKSELKEYPADNPTEFGYSQPFSLSQPVPLHFKHALAAVAVKFHQEYTSENTVSELLECWFENTETDGFHTTGNLIYGIGSSLNQTDYADETEKLRREHNEKHRFIWRTYQTSFDGAKIYHWGLNGTYDNNTREWSFPEFNDEKNQFWNGNTIKNPNTKDVFAYTDLPEDKESTESKLFEENENYVLILPQESSGTVQLYFRLRSSEQEATSVTVPAFTGTNKEGEVCPEESREAEMQDVNTSYNYYYPGHIYIYTVNITRAAAYLNVQMADWKDLHSSTEITF